jgi:hypothetical protein
VLHTEKAYNDRTMPRTLRKFDGNHFQRLAVTRDEAPEYDEYPNSGASVGRASPRKTKNLYVSDTLCPLFPP